MDINIMCSDEKTKVGNTNDEPGTNPKRQLDEALKVFYTLKELSSNPLQKAIEDKVGELAMDAIQQAFSHPTFQEQIANNPYIQKMIIENVFSQPGGEEKEKEKEEKEKEEKEKEKSNPKSIAHEEEEVSIYERLSPGDIYIIRKIGDELEVAENSYGDIVYKRIRLSS